MSCPCCVHPLMRSDRIATGTAGETYTLKQVEEGQDLSSMADTRTWIIFTYTTFPQGMEFWKVMEF